MKGVAIGHFVCVAPFAGLGRLGVQMFREPENKSAFELAIDVVPQIEAPNDAISRCVQFLENHRIDGECIQSLRLAISEAIANALEHGILRLPSAAKEDLFGFRDDCLNERMAELGDGKVALKLELLFGVDGADGIPNGTSDEITAVRVEVTDTGPGFDWRAYLKDHEMPPPEKIYGRGLALIKLAASHLSFNEEGNSIQFVVPCKRAQADSEHTS